MLMKALRKAKSDIKKIKLMVLLKVKTKILNWLYGIVSNLSKTSDVALYYQDLSRMLAELDGYVDTVKILKKNSKKRVKK